MIEPVAINNYSSERTFHLHDVSWNSHALTLHSFGGIFVGDAIDLIFLSTDYVDLPFELDGLQISQLRVDVAVQHEQRFGQRRKLELSEG